MAWRNRWRRSCARLAAGWAAVFAAAHVYWALGGNAGLAVSAGTQLARQRPAWFVAGGLWGVACLCLAGSAVAWSLGEPRPRRLPWTLMRWAARVAGAVMLVRSAVVEALILAGGPGVSAGVSVGQRFWTLVLWNPWFALGGLLFLWASVGESSDVTRPGDTASDNTSVPSAGLPRPSFTLRSIITTFSHTGLADAAAPAAS